VHGPAAHAGGVDDEEGVEDGVDLRGLHDAGEDGVALVGLDELGALQLDPGLLGVEADDRLDVGVVLDRLSQPPTPEAAQPGDEDASPHGR
jgi:hypothetical protein